MVARQHDNLFNGTMRNEAGNFHSYFHDFTDDDFLRLRYCLERILDEAEGKSIAVVLGRSVGSETAFQLEQLLHEHGGGGGERSGGGGNRRSVGGIDGTARKHLALLRLKQERRREGLSSGSRNKQRR